MKVKVLLAFFVPFILLVECSKIYSRQNAGASKKDTLKIAKSFKSKGEVMENLFVVFDPSFLSYVWPKIRNGVHLSIGDSCFEDVSVFLRDLSDGRAWAYRAADASGRYHSGLFEGKRFWLGSKQQCLLLDENSVSESNDTWGEFYSGDYISALLSREKEFSGNMEEWQALLARDELMSRAVRVEHAAPLSLAYTALQLALNITKYTMPKSYEITLGLCLPRSCAAEDVVSIINFSIMLNDNLKSNRTVPRSVKITSLRHVESAYDIKTDIGAVSLILVTACLVLLAIVATVVDLDLIKFKPYTKASSFDLQQYNSGVDKGFVEVKKNNVTRVRDSKIIEAETLSMKNLNELKRAMKEKPLPASIALDAVTADGMKSCRRCGKYKKQCAGGVLRGGPGEPGKPGACAPVKYNSCASLTTDYKKKSSVWKSLLLSFSLKHSWMRVFNTTMANKDLAMVHVLKIVAVFWIIYLHVAVVVSYISENGGDVNDHNTVYYIVSTGTLAFDTLFFVSGLFSAHHFFYLKSRYSVEELVTMGGFCGQALQLICFITNRAIRLLPPYLYAIFLTSVLSRVARDTAPLSLPERYYDNCDQYWWRNLLYLTNLYPRDQQCMQVSWYFSSETQLHAAGALICLLLATRRRVAGALAAALLLPSAAYDLVAAYEDYDQRVANAFALYSVVINRSAARAAPYLAGVLGGWIVHIADGDLTVSKVSWWCLWTASGCSLLASCALPWVRVQWARNAVHLTWPAALLWPLVLSATRYSGAARIVLSSPLVAGLGRLGYCTLLLHGAVSRSVLLAFDTALCSHLTCLLCYFAGCTILSLIAALCLTLLVEMPCCCLLRRISDYTYR